MTVMRGICQGSEGNRAFFTAALLAFGLGLSTLAIAAAPVYPPAQTKPLTPAESLAAQARARLPRGEWDLAIQEADKALQLDKNCYAAIVVRGLVFSGKDDHDKAIEEFDRVTSTTSRDDAVLQPRIEAFLKRSEAQCQKGEYLKAIDSAYFAILEKYENPAAHNQRAVAYIARGQYDKAINSLNIAISLDPKFAEGYCNRGYAYGAKGNFDQDIADQNKALELLSQYAVAAERRAAGYLAKGDLKKAYMDIEQALAWKPGFPDALLDRGRLLVMMKDNAKALASINEAIKSNPKYFKSYLTRGMYYLEQKNAPVALENFDKAIQLNAGHAESYCQRGYAKLAKKENDGAVQDFTKAISLQSGLAAAYSGRAQAYTRLSQNAEAAADKAKYKDLQPAPKTAEKEKEKKRNDPLLQRFVVHSKGVDATRRPDVLQAAQRIDRLVEANYKKYKVTPNPRTSDEQFLRRIYLDGAGSIPTLLQVRKFRSSRDADKRAKLIDELLSSDAYAGHYFNFLADVIRYKDTLSSFVPGAPYRQWLKQSLAENKPWDKIVHEMLSAEGQIWKNPATGYIQRDADMPLDNMNNTVRIFLGTRIGCAQCHNHPFDRWTQKEFYQMAAFTFGTQTAIGGGDKRFYSKDPNARIMEDYAALEQEEEERRSNFYRLGNFIAATQKRVNDVEKKIQLPADYHYDDAKPGQVIEPKTLFGTPAERRAGETPRQAFARWLTAKDNPRFAKTIANRLWKQAFGVGLIEPVDDMMDNTVAENPELMAFLESEMKRLNFDMKEFLRMIFNTETYQRQACFDEVALGEPYHLPGPLLRRMSAEQVWDSFLTLAVVEPDEFRELPAQVRTDYLDVDLTKITAEKALQSDTKFNEMEYGQGPRQQKHIYKGILLGKASELPMPLPPNHFLRAFGQSDRELISTSSLQGSVPQVLFMFNGPITHMLLEKNSTIYNNVVRKDNVPDGVKAIFETVLCRDPDEKEMELAKQEVKAKGLPGYGNVIWSLVNTREFLFIQ